MKQICNDTVTGDQFIDGKPYYQHEPIIERLARNDGLSLEDFTAWFGYPKGDFTGQIICWHPELEYPGNAYELFNINLPFHA